MSGRRPDIPGREDREKREFCPVRPTRGKKAGQGPAHRCAGPLTGTERRAPAYPKRLRSNGAIATGGRSFAMMAAIDLAGDRRHGQAEMLMAEGVGEIGRMPRAADRRQIVRQGGPRRRPSGPRVRTPAGRGPRRGVRAAAICAGSGGASRRPNSTKLAARRPDSKAGDDHRALLEHDRRQARRPGMGCALDVIAALGDDGGRQAERRHQDAAVDAGGDQEMGRPQAGRRPPGRVRPCRREGEAQGEPCPAFARRPAWKARSSAARTMAGSATCPVFSKRMAPAGGVRIAGRARPVPRARPHGSGHCRYRCPATPSAPAPLPPHRARPRHGRSRAAGRAARGSSDSRRQAGIAWASSEPRAARPAAKRVRPGGAGKAQRKRQPVPGVTQRQGDRTAEEREAARDRAQRRPGRQRLGLFDGDMAGIAVGSRWRAAGGIDQQRVDAPRRCRASAQHKPTIPPPTTTALCISHARLPCLTSPSYRFSGISIVYSIRLEKPEANGNPSGEER